MPTAEGSRGRCLSCDLVAGRARPGARRRRRRVSPEAARAAAIRLNRQGFARSERFPPRSDVAMSDRLSSGLPRLDGVLGGGLPTNAINMLIGLPGTGKTILAQQYVFTNATPERPALYLATVSE